MMTMPATLARLFRHAVSYDKPDMVLAKSAGRYRPISSAEVYRRVARLHFELKAVGIESGDRCALMAENRWEWAVVDFAMMTSGIVSVPIYPTLPAEQAHYVLEHSEARVAFISDQEQLDKILEVWDRLPHLEGVVVFDPAPSDESPGDARITALDSLIGDKPLSDSDRTEFESAISSVEPDDLASIIYTSGTTGTPKGVMLTHANFAGNVRDNGLELFETDVALSFLPLSHVAERMADYAFFNEGATVAYAESIEAVPENLREVRPTVAVGVPRFFEKIQAKVLASVAAAPALRRKLFHWALASGQAAVGFELDHRPLPGSLRWKRRLADRLVFSKLRARLGGRLRFFVSGAAPLPRNVAEFFLAAGIKICEGYGLTETSPVVALNYPDSLRPGTVGRIIQNVQVRIADDGEILVQGPNVMLGYYKSDDLTRETIVDGWFHTGDIGRLDADGYLIITDRKKDLCKTSGGKYIAPQPIENQLKTSRYVSVAVVIAHGRRFPSALIVPDFEELKQFAVEHGIDAATPDALSAHPAIQQLIEREVETACAPLARYEQVKKVAVLQREFSIERGEITPTMKVRRREVEKRYSVEIEKLYAPQAG